MLVNTHARGYKPKVPDAESTLWLKLWVFFYKETMFAFNKLVLLPIQHARRKILWSLTLCMSSDEAVFQSNLEELESFGELSYYGCVT